MRTVLAVLISWFALSISSSAQEPVRQADLTGPRTLLVDVDRVNVVFTVSDGRGRLITHLKQRDFEVYEDGRLQRVTNFSAETDLPLNVVLLFDTSGSMRDNVQLAQEAAVRFFHAAIDPGRDRALVISFDTNPELRQGFTNDTAVLDRAVQHIIPGGSTSLYDAVDEAVKQLAAQTGRRVIIILSDGIDNSSHVSLERTVEAAQRNSVAIYAVSTNRMQSLTLPEQKLGDANLARLADETGGRVLHPKNAGHLTHAFTRISQELRSQYSLAYNPSNRRRDGTYREIRIVAAKKTYNVQCRQGYFAPQSGM